MKRINYIGLDVHKKTIAMAKAPEGEKAVEYLGNFANEDKGLRKLIQKLKQLENEEGNVQICYEAGPCGYALRRFLADKGFECDVIAPSLIPTRAGDRIKTDRKDAMKLASFYRAGELVKIKVPTRAEEGARSLVRCRETIREESTRIKQEIVHLLLKQGLVYSGSNWTLAHRDWLRQLKFEDMELQMSLNYYMNRLDFCELTLKDIGKDIKDLAKKEAYRERVAMLTSFKGIQTLTAMSIITEVIDFRRFKSPKSLMSYLGLTPSEYSSGQNVQKGSITKAGNRRARRSLVETARHYQSGGQITQRMQKSLQEVSPDLREIPIRALKRLNKRYYALIHKQKENHKATVAIARELVGFIWDAMQKIENRTCSSMQ